MNVLMIHQNFPGQFRHVASYFMKQPSTNLLAIGRDTAPGLQGVKLIKYRPMRGPRAGIHPYVHSYENAVLHGQQVQRLLLRLKGRGYRPDIVLGHPGWGETLFVKDVYPDVPLVHFCEYYYRSVGADAGFDPEFPSNLDTGPRITARNALHLINLERCDFGITPTRWQHSLHPEAYKPKIHIAHEGIPTDALSPNPGAVFTLPNGKVLRVGDQVVTYVARNLEPYRGFHIFMRAIPHILEKNPNANIVIVGAEGVSYGVKPEGYLSWKEKMEAEHPTDITRVHFLGAVSYDKYRVLLQVSAAHVYLTYPFVLSWSLLEAMAVGCCVIASDTAPVKEVIEDGVNGYLVDFFSFIDVAKKVSQALNEMAEQRSLRESARLRAQDYSVDKGVGKYTRIMAFAANVNI
ncbi:glycosyltransferase family 4 protein [Pseudomonas gingeri]|uniref:glycosyltransferase family 4 protein n=1 Tax=Pseudomonas gingeri TaxID=117681 RepID=UPI0015A40BD1|nr:glycosyltransferase family 4 protein [Pseudomonas gingeri]NWA08440.1 glycosyltransferase [Pseudomonas gingeri]